MPIAPRSPVRSASAARPRPGRGRCRSRCPPAVRRGEHEDARGDQQQRRDVDPLATATASRGSRAWTYWIRLLHYPRTVTDSVDVLIGRSRPDAPIGRRGRRPPCRRARGARSASVPRWAPGSRSPCRRTRRIRGPRSGLAFKHGLTIVNAPGTVDAGYRGEIKVALLNTDAREPYAIEVGDRIAQLIVMPVSRAGSSRSSGSPGACAARGDSVPRDSGAQVRGERVSDIENIDEVPSTSPSHRGSGHRRPVRRVRGEPGPPLRRPGRRRVLPREGLHLRLGRGARKRVVAIGLDYATHAPGAAVRRAAHERPVARDPSADRRPDRPPGRHHHGSRGRIRTSCSRRSPSRRRRARPATCASRASSASTAPAGSSAA